MPVFKLNRNYVLRSLLGHTVNFVKDVETYVAPELVNECVKIGAEQVDGTPDVLGPEAVEAVPMSPDERAAAINAAFDKLVATNARDDFTATGIPQVKAVERVSGFNIDVKERDALWQKRREALAGA